MMISLFGFAGEKIGTRGCIWLYTRFGHEEAKHKDLKIQYVVVHDHTSYNILLNRPSLNTLGAIMSTPHLAMKFSSETRSIIIVHADQKMARKCYMASMKIGHLVKDETCQVVHYVDIIARAWIRKTRP